VPKIYFIRHGQTDWNADARLQGTTDIPLNETGKAQAHHNGVKLRDLIGDGEGFDFVSGPLQRTVLTMQLVRSGMGLEPDAFRRDPELMEVGFGDWEGKRWTEIRETNNDGVEAYLAAPLHFAPPNGEGYGGAHVRAVRWLEAVTQDTVVVSHGGINRVLRGHLLGVPEPEIVHLHVPQDKIMEIIRHNGQQDVVWH